LSGATKVVVAWNGADVVAGTTGTGSAFAISKDDGKSFNDISMIDSAGNLNQMLDIQVSADGSVMYMMSYDATAGMSLFRYEGSWERVLTVTGTTDSIVRIAPEDEDAVYVADRGGDSVYYSSDGGNNKWFNRTSKEVVGDMAIESADVAYVAVSGAKTVSKSTNGGFTWGSGEDTGVGGSFIWTIRSLGEDMIIVGSDDGHVAWSDDGNNSWTSISTGLKGGAETHVTASGLADGDYIYATCNVTTDNRVERWEIGQSGTSWSNLECGFASNLRSTGIELVEGVLYVQSANDTDSRTMRNLSPTSGDPASSDWSHFDSEGESFQAIPSSLRVSAGSTTLWSVNKVNAAAGLHYVADTLATDGPTLSSPADGFKVAMNPVSGTAYDVALTWERLSKAKRYQLQVALDSGFAEKIAGGTINVPSADNTTSSSISYVLAGGEIMPDTMYYWKVRVKGDSPVLSPWSAVRTFSVGSLPEAQPPVVIEQPPAPVIEVPPTPEIVLQPPEIVLPAPPPAPPEIVIPAAPAPTPAVPTWAIYAIIIIGAVLVIALIVLIMRTRRPV
jgi:hypothetical protein